MRVGVNTLTIQPGYGGGAEHYLRRVLHIVRKVQPDIEFLLFTDEDNSESFEDWEQVCLEGDEPQLDQVVKRGEIDALFTPLRTAMAKCPVPQVIFTLELMDFEKTADRRSRYEYGRIKAMKRICKEAAAIVAPSKFLQRRCLELLDVSLDRVIVAPLGVDDAFSFPQSSLAEEP
ncbi:MAG: hypothetical protein QG656_1562, partial [Candidatus Hydrogenedentes bacterium]|nr:hypothetical protein [Candidatus Hydrogenedentota bacterium]